MEEAATAGLVTTAGLLLAAPVGIAAIGGGLMAGAVGLMASQRDAQPSTGAFPTVSQPSPTTESPEVKAAREREQVRLSLLKGRRSTILTGPLGLPDEPSVGRKTLLGG